MTASRTDLIAWVNELLQLNYTKIEQCGAGGAYCQILDSIYGDVPMAKVKMNAKHEYEYVANYKVLQNVFKAKRIDKPIPVERLIKCKMQDNLEFVQWMKKFWDQNYGGQPYDAAARRKGLPTDVPVTVAPITTSGAGKSLGVGVGGASRPGGRTPLGGGASAAEVHNLTGQITELNAHLDGLEKERQFYFTKLRDIEILVQQELEVLEQEGKDDETLREIQKILYSTEEGFEVPESEAAGADEEETF